MNVYGKALVLFVLVCTPIVFLYTFYKRVSFEFPQTGSNIIASQCKLATNQTVVQLLNDIENLDWENMLIPIMPMSRHSGQCDVNIFRARVNGDKTPIPGTELRIEYIRYLDYVMTIKVLNADEMYSGAKCFVQKSRSFDTLTPGRATAPVKFCTFVMLNDNGSRVRLQCFIPAINNLISVCEGNAGKYFPINNTTHENHLMSNPIFNIDPRFTEFK